VLSKGAERTPTPPWQDRDDPRRLEAGGGPVAGFTVFGHFDGGPVPECEVPTGRKSEVLGFGKLRAVDGLRVSRQDVGVTLSQAGTLNEVGLSLASCALDSGERRPVARRYHRTGDSSGVGLPAVDGAAQ
jgi:hypothetical protein